MAPKPNLPASSDSEDSSSSQSSPPDRSSGTLSATEENENHAAVSKSSHERAVAAKSSESNSDSEVTDASGKDDSDSENGSESDSEVSVPASAESGRRASVRLPTQFKPPTGFKAAKSSAPSSSKVSEVLSNLRGKKVFHITAPSFFPISKVEEVSLGKLAQGEPFLVQDGVTYGITTEDLNQQYSNETTLLLYDKNSQSYYRAPASDIQSYHIREIINAAPQKTIDTIAVESAKQPKPQPKHLKMRFRPVGSAEGPPETFGTSSESEGEDTRQKIAKVEERKRKHRHPEADESSAAVLPRKTPKKRSSQIENEDRGHEKSKKTKMER